MGRVETSGGAPPSKKLLRAVSGIRPAPLASVLCRLLGLHRRVPFQTPQGLFWLSPMTDLGRRLLIDGYYEPSMIQTLNQCLRPGGTFIDAGANEGYFSVVASRLVGDAGRVIAIEPQDRLQKVIQQNLLLNGCSNVSVIRAALGESCGEVTLNLAADMNTGASSMFSTAKYPLQKERVPCCSLARLMEDCSVDKCSLLKIDVEGAEHLILMSASDLLASGKIETIAVEFHDAILARLGVTRHEVDSFLHGLGYATRSAGPHSVYSRVPLREVPFV